MRIRSISLAVVASSALLLTACGSDDDSAADTSDAASTADADGADDSDDGDNADDADDADDQDSADDADDEDSADSADDEDSADHEDDADDAGQPEGADEAAESESDDQGSTDDESEDAGDTADAPDGSASGSIPEGWIVINDDGSGISVAMPEDVEPQEHAMSITSDLEVDARGYFTLHDDVEIGFSVLDASDDAFGFDAAWEGMLSMVSDNTEIVDQNASTIDGRDTRDATMSIDSDGEEALMRTQLVDLGDYAVHIVAGGYRGDVVETAFESIVGSIDAG